MLSRAGTGEQAQTGTCLLFSDASRAPFLGAWVEIVSVQFPKPKPGGTATLFSQEGGGFCKGPSHVSGALWLLGT